MAPFYLILALLIQCSISYADLLPKKNETESQEIVLESEDIPSSLDDLEYDIKNKSDEDIVKDESSDSAPDNAGNTSEIEDVLIKDFRAATNDWVDMFLGSNSELHPSSSATLMAQATNSNKSPEEQLEEIKEVANEITMAIQSEMTNLLSYALNYCEKDSESEKDNKLRKRRSIESPMDSSQLVMRLLNHIKSNNEYQNIAIEKMMSAQEIADKYGVDFNPDPEILSDLAFAANEQAKELTSILQDACDAKNLSCIVETNLEPRKQPEESMVSTVDNTTYFRYSVDCPEMDTQAKVNTAHTSEPSFQAMSDVPSNHIQHSNAHIGYNYYYSYPHDTQITSPPAQHSCGASVTPRPTFYDSISYNPKEFYSPYCSVDPMAYPFVYPIDEPLDLEPELVGEEYEESVSSKIIIEQDDEPGSATLNHVMTYTVSEKAHLRTPQIEKLPQQMQYYFFLM